MTRVKFIRDQMEATGRNGEGLPEFGEACFFSVAKRFATLCTNEYDPAFSEYVHLPSIAQLVERRTVEAKC